MDTKERMTRLQESLKENPIKLFEAESLEVGWAFFWRQMILMAPAYAFSVWGEMREGRIERIPGPAFVVILAVLIPYVFAALGAAESWRGSGRLMPAEGGPARLLKTGFSLWWRIVLGFLPFLGLLYVAGFVLGAAGMNMQGTVVLLGIAWLGLVVPVMGRAVRHWHRTLAIEKGMGVAGAATTADA